MMKALLTSISAALLLITVSLPARADDASKAAKIEQMLVLTHADRLVEQITAQIKPMMAAQMQKLNLPDDARPAMEEMQTKMTEIIASKLSWDKMKPLYIKLYSETLSEEEIDGAVQFYKTPAGQALLDKMPLLMQKSMMAVQDMMGDLIPELTKMTDDVAKKYKK